MSQATWRTPLVVLACGTTILMLGFGVRQVSGLFIAPVSADMGWERSAFSIAIAVQALVWGLCTPLSGAVADKFGAGRVVALGGLLYAFGLYFLSRTETPLDAALSFGVLAGVGMSTGGFSVILAVIGRAAPANRRSLYLGIASAGGSSGQFFLVPATQYFIDGYGWAATLLILAVMVGLIVPMAAALAGGTAADRGMEERQSIREALAEAVSHRGFLLLMSAYFVCGFQVSFISAHLPGYLSDAGSSTTIAAWALSMVGLFNIIGCFLWGRLGDVYTKKYLLSLIYLGRAMAMALFVLAPLTDIGVLIFGAVMGILWLATVPLTTGLIAQIFGLQYMATLTGSVFVSHQMGSALGVWLGGEIHAATGTYQAIWWIAIVLGLAAAILHFPIDDRPLERTPVGEAA